MYNIYKLFINDFGDLVTRAIFRDYGKVIPLYSLQL